MGTKSKISGANLFMRLNYWVVYGGGKRLPGLVRRRKMEADLYFS